MVSNSYFKFKQFTVHQDKTAMKVCTDSCLFGAWLVKQLSDIPLPNQKVLDIGTGTGLLSLMLSQELSIETDAVEIEENAYQQALANTSESPWQHRIQIIHSDIRDFLPAIKYGLIVSNPPFFENDVKSQEATKNLARHESSIQLEGLFSRVSEWLAPGGYFALLLPAPRSGKAVKAGLLYGLQVCKETMVKQTIHHDPFRVMLLFSNQPGDLTKSTLSIKENNQYTSSFRELLAPYYLHL